MLLHSNFLSRWIAGAFNNLVTRNLHRPPDFIIGGADNPYMLRWYIIRTRFGGAYVHEFIRSDNDVHHDHPWPSVSLALGQRDGKGVLMEEIGKDVRTIAPGDVALRSAKFAHRILVHEPGFRTLFIIGPKVRSWGFLCPQGWVHWKDFTALDKDGSSIPRGCGEVEVLTSTPKS